MIGRAFSSMDVSASLPRLAGMAVAIAITAALLWLIGGSGLLALTYAGGMAAIVMAILASTKLHRELQADVAIHPDWSVTGAAIENSRRAIAITDRANRMTCANTAYGEWFENEVTPFDLSLDEDSRRRLLEGARQAWREGSVRIDKLRDAAHDPRWHVGLFLLGSG